MIVLNFLAAVESKFLKNVSHEILLLSPEKHKHDFCFSIEECRKSFPQAMDEAKEFYQVKQGNYFQLFHLSGMYEDRTEHPLRLQLENY